MIDFKGEKAYERKISGNSHAIFGSLKLASFNNLAKFGFFRKILPSKPL